MAQTACLEKDAVKLVCCGSTISPVNALSAATVSAMIAAFNSFEQNRSFGALLV